MRERKQQPSLIYAESTTTKELKLIPWESLHIGKTAILQPDAICETYKVLNGDLPMVIHIVPKRLDHNQEERLKEEALRLR